MSILPYSWGIGTEIYLSRKSRVNLRLDFGLSPDGLEIYANVQEAFLARQDGRAQRLDTVLRINTRCLSWFRNGTTTGMMDFSS